MPSIGLLRLTAGDRSPKKVRRRSDASIQLPPASVLNSWLLPVTAHIQERRADDSPFYILPPEIIESVFVSLVCLSRPTDVAIGDEVLDDSPYDHRFRLKPNLAVSAVCKKWRSIALRCPMVWHRITPNDADSRFVWTQLCISRSGSTCPLDIMFDWPAPPNPCNSPNSTVTTASERDDKDAALTVMRLLLPHASRWRSFSADVSQYWALFSILQSIAHLATAPRLLHLSIVNTSHFERGPPRLDDTNHLWHNEISAMPSLGRFLRSAPRLRSLALWNCVESVTWPNQPLTAPQRLSKLSVACSDLPQIQRSMIESYASKLTELVLLLGPPNSLYAENLSLPPIDLPILQRLVLVGPDANARVIGAHTRLPQLLAGLLRVPSVHTLEFHSCDEETIKSFVGIKSSAGNERDSGIKRADEIFPDVRRLVLTDIIVPLPTAPSGALQPLYHLAAAIRALPGVTALTLQFRIESMPLNIQGADYRIQPANNVDISGMLVGSATAVGTDFSVNSETGMLRGEILPLPSLLRLDCEGVSLENLSRVLKNRKKHGARPLDSLRVHLQVAPPQSTSPSRSQSQQSFIAPSQGEVMRLKGREKDYEAKLGQLVRHLTIVRKAKGGERGQYKPPWFF